MDDNAQKELRALERKVDALASRLERNNAVVSTELGYIKAQLDKLSQVVGDGYVTKAEFEPIKKVVYGMVALMLTSVVGGLLALIIRT